ncbi:hypothetical protein BHE74_00017445 [Ensete ventricosum]|nr:hypothetical protein BHE74_00017445 [Ensete ventricosum]
MTARLAAARSTSSGWEKTWSLLVPIPLSLPLALPFLRCVVALVLDRQPRRISSLLLPDLSYNLGLFRFRLQFDGFSNDWVEDPLVPLFAPFPLIFRSPFLRRVVALVLIQHRGESQPSASRPEP